MTDLDLLHAVEASLPGLTAFHRDLYALARLRVVRLAMQARLLFKAEGGDHV